MDSQSQELKYRPIRKIDKRKPEGILKNKNFIREVSRRTGYRLADIKEVYDVMIEVIMEAMCEKKRFQIRGLGLFYPTIKRGRFTTSLNGAVKAPTKTWMPSRWVLRFQPSKNIAQRLLKVNVDPKEEEEMYYGKTNPN